MSTITTFDLERFTRAAEQRDASTQLSMYAPQATVTITDRVSQPGSPRVLSTHEEIKAWLEDTYGRDMTHSVDHTVSDESGVAYTQACRYADGTNVLCATVIELQEGLIGDQTIVQVWDER
ncbi:MAG: nuclear transport factor 2 family protein [Solirubrobacterales bacterium]|nr:nuclear transport factor 2 family protein [Solirubrobacterales bacterium]